MSYTDRCPDCGTINDPEHTLEVPGGVDCQYRCLTCGHTWTAAWWPHTQRH